MEASKSSITELKYKTKPYQHQVTCLNQYGRRHYFALLAEQGTGKTWIIINNAADLWSCGECDAILVAAPNGVQTNWTYIEIPKHMPDWVIYNSYAYTGKKTKRDKELQNDLYADKRALRIMTINWEALQTKNGFEAAKRFCNTANKLMIVCDESDAMKNPKAARTKALMKLKPYSTYRRIMTGTPINNAPFDAFTQFSFLHTGILGTQSFAAFKAEYGIMLEDGNPLLEAIRRKTGSRYVPQVVAKDMAGRPKYKNLGKLSALIDAHSFRVLKDDCLDLPPKVYKNLFFELTPQQKKVYATAKEDCRFIVEGEASAFTKLVAITKLAQITSGYYILKKGEEPVRIEGDNPKLDLLAARVKVIMDEGRKVIIWARYRIEIADIAKRLTDYKVVEYHGGVSKKDREAGIQEFENGDAQIFLGNQQAGGRGLTLVAANYVIYFSNNFSLRDRLQSEDRAHRIGQTRTVTYINIAALRTIDVGIVAALENKKDVAEAIIDRSLSYFNTPE